ncbi:MAG: hypothetical protein MJE77_24635 [Proteobacteria bacterium]|nr:hypothetical protein [Pseudomonadota bacterium]
MRSTVVLATDDGMTLSFDRRARRFARIAVPGFDAALASGAGQLGIALFDHRGAGLARSGQAAGYSIDRARSSLVLTRDYPRVALRIEERWTARAERIELHAAIAHTGRPIGPQPVARAMEACVELPVDLIGQRWYHDLDQSEVIRPQQTYRTTLTHGLDIASWGSKKHLQADVPINLHGVNLIANRAFGLAMAALPEQPAAYYVSYDAGHERYAACFHLGIYGRHKTRPHRVSFGLALFHPDQPAWGLRSALEKYARSYPGAFRGSAPRRSGMLVGGAYSYKFFPDPAAFRIGAMWNGYFRQNREHGIPSLLYAWPTGYVDRGMRLGKREVSGGCAGCDPSARAHLAACLALYRDYDAGQLHFAETCRGPWSVTRCRPNSAGTRRNAARAPGTAVYGPVRSGRQYYTLRPLRVVEPSNLPLRLFGSFAIYKPLSASYLRGPGGQFLGSAQALMSIDRSATPYTCYINGLNPDPGVTANVPHSDPEPNAPPFETENFGQLNLEIARRAVGVYGGNYLHAEPTRGVVRFDGVAVDTVGAYLRSDFNPAMLEIASLPLAYQRASGRPVALEHLGLTAFLRRLRQSLPADHLIAINGYPISGTLGQDVDMFMREMGRRMRHEAGDKKPRLYDEWYDEDFATRMRRINRQRMVALQRPITFWAHFHRTEARAVREGRRPVDVLLQDMRRILPLYTAKGIYIYVRATGIASAEHFFTQERDPRVIAEYKKHLHTVHQLQLAGWQPVPHVVTSDPAISVERFGSALFTLYNPTRARIRTRVGIRWPRVAPSCPGRHSRPCRPRGVGQLGKQNRFEATIDDDEIALSNLDIGPGDIEILAVQYQTAKSPTAQNVNQ